MHDQFAQRVMVHRVLGDRPESVPSELRPAPKRLVHRLRDRARLVARSLMDRRSDRPPIADELDARLDEHVLNPNRRAIVRRTVALERWLADHGFKEGRPVRYLRDHRVLRYHGEPLELPVARPVVRSTDSSADRFLTTRILDGIARRRPQTDTNGRVSVIPGFMLVELPFAEFDEQFGLGESDLVRYGHLAIGTLPLGPVIVATRDVTGELIAHQLLSELTDELASIGSHQHQHWLPTPGELLHAPDRVHQVNPPLLNPASFDHAAEQLVTQRLHQHGQPCRLMAGSTLSDLGFTPHDWVSLATAHHHFEPYRTVAQLHLASLLLARALLSAFDDHADQQVELTVYPSAALASVRCNQPWHRHVTAYDQYGSFILAAPELGPQALDELYQRLVNPALDFAHAHTTPHPVRLHLYPAPLHSVA